MKIIIPLGPGGGGDVFTRLMAEELQKRFGQPFIVENRPGGGLNIGTRACAEAAPDGYTFCVLSGEPVVYNQFTFKSLPYNPEKDFEPVVNLFINANALVVNSSLGVKTIPGAGRARQGQARHAELRHLLVHAGLLHGPAEQEERHRHRAGAVPQRQRDGQRGDDRHDADRVPRPLQHDRPGQERAVHRPRAQLQRAPPLFPDIPTLAEATGEDYPPPWFGLFAPAGTPLPIVDKMHDEVVRIASVPDWRQRNFVERAVEPATGPRDEFIKFIANNRAFAARVAKEAGIQPQ